MRDIKFFRKRIRYLERAFSPYRRNHLLILVFLEISSAIRDSGMSIIFLATGSVSFSFAVSRCFGESGVLSSAAAFVLISAPAMLLPPAAWAVLIFKTAHRHKLDYQSAARGLLPFFGLLNIFAPYALFGGPAVLPASALLFLLSAAVYHRAYFLKKMNYKGKEFILWHLYPVSADALDFPIEREDRCQKFKVTLQDDTRNALLALSGEDIVSGPVKISKGDLLAFSIGLAEKVFTGDCVFEVRVSVDRAPEEKIFWYCLQPSAKITDRGWKEFRIDLGRYDKKEAVFSFSACPVRGHGQVDAYWEFPRVMRRQVPSDSRISPPARRLKDPIENIVILLLDAARADLLRQALSVSSGMPGTTNFFSADSLICNQAISQNDWTIPAFISIFSGRYLSSHRHFASQTYPLCRHRPVSRDVPWLPEILRRQGYMTCAFSSYHEINPAYGFARGFDSFYNDDDFNVVDHGEKVSLHGLRFLKENKGRKKFLFLHYFTAHRPFLTRHPYRMSGNLNIAGKFNHEDINAFVAAPYEMMSERDRQVVMDVYTGALVQADHELSMIFDYLLASGEAARSLVMFISDHGYTIFDRNSFFPKANHLYDEVLRVPFFMRAPVFNCGPTKQIGYPVEANVDVAPTILDAAGCGDVPAMDGQSLIRSERGEIPPRGHTVSELFNARHNMYMLALRGERHKLVSTYEIDSSKPFSFGAMNKKEDLLFDLSADSKEEKSIARESGGILLRYERLRDSFIDSQRQKTEGA